MSEERGFPLEGLIRQQVLHCGNLPFLKERKIRRSEEEEEDED